MKFFFRLFIVSGYITSLLSGANPFMSVRHQATTPIQQQKRAFLPQQHAIFTPRVCPPRKPSAVQPQQRKNSPAGLPTIAKMRSPYYPMRPPLQTQQENQPLISALMSELEDMRRTLGARGTTQLTDQQLLQSYAMAKKVPIQDLFDQIMKRGLYGLNDQIDKEIIERILASPLFVTRASLFLSSLKNKEIKSFQILKILNPYIDHIEQRYQGVEKENQLQQLGQALAAVINDIAGRGRFVNEDELLMEKAFNNPSIAKGIVTQLKPTTIPTLVENYISHQSPIIDSVIEFGNRDQILPLKRYRFFSARVRSAQEYMKKFRNK